VAGLEPATYILEVRHEPSGWCSLGHRRRYRRQHCANSRIARGIASRFRSRPWERWRPSRRRPRWPWLNGTIRFTQPFEDAGIRPSVGSAGDSNALAEDFSSTWRWSGSIAPATALGTRPSWTCSAGQSGGRAWPATPATRPSIGVLAMTLVGLLMCRYGAIWPRCRP
jgi:hypothetical protein